MEEMEDIGFEDFESALFDDDYQTGTDGDDEVTEPDEDTPQEDGTDEDFQDEPEDGAEDEEEHTSETEETGAEEEKKPDSDTPAEQTFTLKVNKEERQVTLEEMTALAQKGADYDRVKEQNKGQNQTIQELRAKLDGQQGVMDVLEMVARKSGSTLEQLAQTLYVNFRKGEGASEDAARLELEKATLEKERDSLKQQQEQKQDAAPEDEDMQRAKKDLEDFRQEYPDVQLSRELLKKLAPDIRSGKGLAAAYRRYEKAQQETRIAELERKLAAKDQNARNQRNSPGSQKDTGGRRTRSDYEDFEKALFG